MLYSRTAGRRGLLRELYDERGSLTVFSLFVIIIMLFAGGMAVDFMRQESARARLQSTLDRAVLAAADMDQQVDSTTLVKDYFAKSGITGYDLTVTPGVDGFNARSVSATASKQIDSYFMQFLGINHLTAPAAGAAGESISNVEISLVLDVSGSMGETSASGKTKIAELKTAANAFLDTVFKSAAAGRTTVSIIPYSTQVNVGKDLLSELNLKIDHDYSYCADFKQKDFNSDSIRVVDSLEQTAHEDPFSGSGTKSLRNVICRTDAAVQVLPISDNITDLKAKVNSLSASGNTSIEIGMKWGAALLNHDLQPAVSGLVDKGDVKEKYRDFPLDPDTRDTLKVIVVMTDGINTTQWVMASKYKNGASHAWSSADGKTVAFKHGNQWYYPETGNWSSNGPGDNNTRVNLSYPELFARYTVNWHAAAYAKMTGNWLDQLLWTNGITDWLGNLLTPGLNSTVSPGEKDNRLDAVCGAAKTDNVRVYTIGFEVTKHSEQVMEDCASSKNYAYLATGLNITQVFEQIASDISKLRLTQ